MKISKNLYFTVAIQLVFQHNLMDFYEVLKENPTKIIKYSQ